MRRFVKDSPIQTSRSFFFLIKISFFIIKYLHKNKQCGEKIQPFISEMPKIIDFKKKSNGQNSTAEMDGIISRVTGLLGFNGLKVKSPSFSREQRTCTVAPVSEDVAE